MTPQEALLVAMNAQRVKAGCPALSSHATLQKAAQGHAEWMVANGVFSHYGPGGNDWIDRVHDAGPYPRVLILENIAVDRDATACVAAWMNSAGHRDTMLDRKGKFLAAGCGATPIKTGKYAGQLAWVAVFGATSGTVQPPPPPPKPIPPPFSWRDWWKSIWRFMPCVNSPESASLRALSGNPPLWRMKRYGGVSNPP